MTMEAYAHKKAEELKKKPTYDTIIKVVNDIKNLNVGEQKITDNQINVIIGYLKNELGDLGVLQESFENKDVLSLMSEVKKLIAQANSGK